MVESQSKHRANCYRYDFFYCAPPRPVICPVAVIKAKNCVRGTGARGRSTFVGNGGAVGNLDNRESNVFGLRILASLSVASQYACFMGFAIVLDVSLRG